MIYPKPFAADILDSTAAGRAVVNNGASGCQFALSSNSISVTATVGDESSLKFYNSASSGLGGRVFEIGSTISGTTGTMPFVFGAVEFDVNDDSSRDFNVFLGHGFNSAGGLQSGAAWGASGIVFEQHYNPSGATNQSEIYFRLLSLQGGGTEYRPLSIIHADHDKTDGTDTIQVYLLADTQYFTTAAGVTKAFWSDSTLTFSAGQTVIFNGSSTNFTIDGSGGRIQSNSTSHVFNPTVTTDASVITIQPTINVASGKAVVGIDVSPGWTLATGSTFVGYRSIGYASRATSLSAGFEANPGVNGAVTVATATGFRSNPQAYTGTVTDLISFHGLSITSTGTVTNGYAVKIENQTGFWAWHSGTGKHQFGGDGTANTLIGFYGTTPIARQTGVAVSAAGIHAALVNLGLITA